MAIDCASRQFFRRRVPRSPLSVTAEFMEQQSSSAGPASAPSEQPEGIWRSEVQARVAGYRTRRGRRIEGAFSMRFPFPPAEPTAASEMSDIALSADAAPLESAPHGLTEEPGITLRVDTTAALPQVSLQEAAAAPAEEFELPPPPPPRSKKVIAFPRPVPDPAEYESAFVRSEERRVGKEC